MSPRVVDHLWSARRGNFVGRKAEKSLLRSALTMPQLPFFVLFITGPGGVGKSSLLYEFIELGQECGARTLYVDGRNVDATPAGLLNALAEGMEISGPEQILEELGHRSRRTLLLLDTYEALSSIDAWLRDEFLPQLSDRILVVIAGRSPPALAWQTHPGWSGLTHQISLRNLDAETSREYLQYRAVPLTAYDNILSFTHGHPLALSLIADVFDQRADFRFEPAAVPPDIVKALLEQFVQKVPGPAHRTALEVCSLLRSTTEDLLAEILHIPDAHELFQWLRSLSFIQPGRRGVFPHDLAREALLTDLQWRNPEWYSELRTRARASFVQRLQQSGTQGQRRILRDYIFLHRSNPMVQPFYVWEESATWTDQFRPADRSLLLAMVEQHEGAESARLAAHWIDIQPYAVSVIRDEHRQPIGFLLGLSLADLAPEQRGQDPAVQAAWTFLEEQIPLRPGERVTYFRFWMDRDAYQAVSPVQSRIFINCVQHYLTTPKLAYTLFSCSDPDFWADVFVYADLHRLPVLDYEIGGREYGVYGHDWRAVPPTAWLDLLAERETARDPQAVMPLPRQQLLVLSQSDFASAVRDALRSYARPVELVDNPLLRSQLVVAQAGLDSDQQERVQVLCRLLQEAANTLQASAKGERYYRALHRTYFQPAATQEAAAELLGLPFSTYRRHLRTGIDRVIQLLWQVEIGAVDSIAL